jgi:hypothetical protein
MKIIVRCLVVALAITGAIATTSANGSSVKTSAVASKTSAMPEPTCPPSSGNYCGLDQPW